MDFYHLSQASQTQRLLGLYPTLSHPTINMRFTPFIVAGFAAMASAIPASQVISNIDQITTMSRELQTPSKNLGILDGPLLVTGQGNFPVGSFISPIFNIF